MGRNAWATRFDGSGMNYSENAGNSTGLDWIFSVTVRVVSPNVNPYGDTFGAGIDTALSDLGLEFGSDSNGNQMVLFPAVGEYTITGPAAYNTYLIIYDAASSTASFWVNGTEKVSGISGFVPGSAALDFGGEDQETQGYQANWSSVSLEIIPEPSAGWLGVFGGGCLIYLNARWHRRR